MMMMIMMMTMMMMVCVGTVLMDENAPRTLVAREMAFKQVCGHSDVCLSSL
jgi:hypothetical protein